jgi:hypothetical protein
LALQHKGDLTDLTALPDALELRQGPSMGAAWLVYQVAQRLGIENALGTTRAGKSTTTRRAGGLRMPPRGGRCVKNPLKGDRQGKLLKELSRSAQPLKGLRWLRMAP